MLRCALCSVPFKDTGSTDHIVTDLNPFQSLFAAVTGRDFLWLVGNSFGGFWNTILPSYRSDRSESTLHAFM